MTTATGCTPRAATRLCDRVIVRPQIQRKLAEHYHRALIGHGVFDLRTLDLIRSYS